MTLKPKVVVVGPLSATVRDRLADLFDTTLLPLADADLVPPHLAEEARGMAVLGAVGAAFIDRLPKLEIIASFGVGYDRVDTAHAARSGITVTNTPDVLNEDVADAAIGLLLNTLREFPRAEAFLRQGHWAGGARYPITRGTLRGRRIGIFGLGRVGRAIARRLEPFGVEILYHNRRPVENVPWRWCPSLLSLASEVDTLICAAPGTAATHNAVDAGVLKALGADGVVVNIGRGSLVDEPALIDALRNGTILAAGLDVFAGEPHVPQGLLDLPNAVLLPHVGSATAHTRGLMDDLMVANLVEWFSAGQALTPVPET